MARPVKFFCALLLMLSSSLCVATDELICEDIRQLMGKPSEKLIYRYRLDSNANPDELERYPNLDLDGDDIGDIVMGGCYGTSTVPSDPCYLRIELSTGRNFNFTFDIAERFFLIRWKSGFYAIASPTVQISEGTSEAQRLSFDQTKGRRSVIRLDRSGVRRICTKI